MLSSAVQVVYTLEGTELFISTVRMLKEAFRASHRAASACPRVLFAYDRRGRVGLSRCLSALGEMGLRIDNIPTEDNHPRFRSEHVQMAWIPLMSATDDTDVRCGDGGGAVVGDAAADAAVDAPATAAAGAAAAGAGT